MPPRSFYKNRVFKDSWCQAEVGGVPDWSYWQSTTYAPLIIHYALSTDQEKHEPVRIPSLVVSLLSEVMHINHISKPVC